MRYLLFTTTICPKCPEFKDLMEAQSSIPGEILNEQSPYFAEKIADFGLSQAPTLIVLSDDDKIQLETSDLSIAKDFLSSL